MPRRILEKKQQRDRIKNPHETGPVEGGAPAERRLVGDIAGKPTDHDAAVDPHLMDSHGARARFPKMEIGDQGEGRRDVEGLADAHEGARPEELGVAVDLPRPPGDARPNEETAADREPAAETIGDIAADGTEEGVDEFKLP